MNNILQRIQDAVSRGEIQNPLVLELCDEIGKTVVELPKGRRETTEKLKGEQEGNGY